MKLVLTGRFHAVDSWIGKTKFQALNSATKIIPDKLFNIFNENSQQYWDFGNYATIDELIAPTTLNHPCVQHIDSKPHNDGIWITTVGENLGKEGILKRKVTMLFSSIESQSNLQCHVCLKPL